MKKEIMNYIKIARPDHCIKQFFIFPGVLFAIFITKGEITNYSIFNIVLAFLATSFIASANYVINEWLDAKTDQYHPTKKKRPLVNNNLKVAIIIIEYVILAILGLLISFRINRCVLVLEGILLLMGVLYNVKPFRSKDIVYIDVLTESINNALRFLIGWFTITNVFLPPISIVLGYWMGGAFLMASKRYAEYRMIDNKELAGLYRKSFKYYTEKSLLISSFFYALVSVFFCGIFMIKYKIELLISIPLLCGLFCFYINLSYKEDSSVQKPEKLYREKGLIIYITIFTIISTILLFVDIPIMNLFLETTILQL